MLTLNGVYFGLTDTFERSAEVNLSDRIYAEFSPQEGGSVHFFLSEELLTVPPIGCEVYLLQDGVALYARDFPPTDFTLRPIAQARFDDCIVSVFQQGTVQLSIQTQKDFFTASLPSTFQKCALSMHADLLFIHSETHLAVFTKEGKRALYEEVTTFAVEGNTLHATLPLSDSLGRVADCAWNLSKDGCVLTQFTLRQTHTESDQEMGVEKELLAYAFFESILLGIDCAHFLAESLQPNAKQMVDFLGKFHAVTLTNDPFTCGLVREKAPRLFEVCRYTVKVEDGKIVDITT